MSELRKLASALPEKEPFFRAFYAIDKAMSEINAQLGKAAKRHRAGDHHGAYLNLRHALHLLRGKFHGEAARALSGYWAEIEAQDHAKDDEAALEGK